MNFLTYKKLNLAKIALLLAVFTAALVFSFLTISVERAEAQGTWGMPSPTGASNCGPLAGYAHVPAWVVPHPTAFGTTCAVPGSQSLTSFTGGVCAGFGSVMYYGLSQTCIPSRVDCVGSWGPWSSCSGPGCGAGAGEQSRRYSVSVPASGGGAACPARDGQTQVRSCDLAACVVITAPVDCRGYWTGYSSCSVSCGGGTQSRSFIVTTAPANGGAGCPASPQSRSCNTSSCVTLCSGFWSYSSCSASCGGGTSVGTYNVTGGGAVCQQSPRVVSCNTQSCVPPPTNLPPYSNAGRDEPITLPDSSFTVVDSSANDPESLPMTFEWSQTSGPTFASISDTSVLRPTFIGMTLPGNYEFRLRVIDSGGLIDNDRMTVNVSNPPPPPAATTYNLNITETGPAAAAGTTNLNPGSPCSSDCIRPYADGTDVTVTGLITGGTVIFTGPGCSSNSCMVTMNTDRSVTASYSCNSGRILVGSNCVLSPADASLSSATPQPGNTSTPTGLVSGSEVLINVLNQGSGVIPAGANIPVTVELTHQTTGVSASEPFSVSPSTNLGLNNSFNERLNLGTYEPGVYDVVVTINPGPYDDDPSNNSLSRTMTLVLSPPNMNISIDSDVIRRGTNAEIEVTISSTFGVTCDLTGPGGIRLLGQSASVGVSSYEIVVPPSTTHNDIYEAGPLNSTSVYTLSCRSTSDPTITFAPITDTVDVIPTIEEI